MWWWVYGVAGILSTYGLRCLIKHEAPLYYLSIKHALCRRWSVPQSKNITYTRVPWHVKVSVAYHQGYKCMDCKGILPETWECDHVIPRALGGTNVVHNLVILCPNCHRNKTEFVDRPLWNAKR